MCANIDSSSQESLRTTGSAEELDSGLNITNTSEMPSKRRRRRRAGGDSAVERVATSVVIVCMRMECVYS